MNRLSRIPLGYPSLVAWGPDIYGVIDFHHEFWVETLMSLTLKAVAVTYLLPIPFCWRHGFQVYRVIHGGHVIGDTVLKGIRKQLSSERR